MVTVQGASSEVRKIRDQVFQGTVLGPPLWNTFFADVDDAARSSGGAEKMFADDLTVSKYFDLEVNNDVIVTDMNATRTEVHRWDKGIG